MYNLVTQSANSNIADRASVLSYTVDSSVTMVDIVLAIGNAGNPLNAGSNFTLTIEAYIDGASVFGVDPQIEVQQARTRLLLYLDPIPVSSGSLITVFITSSSFSDSNVSVMSTVRNLFSGLVDTMDADPPAVNLSAAAISSVGNEVSTRAALGLGLNGNAETSSTTLTAFQGETIPQSVTAVLADLTTPVDLSGITLELVFESTLGVFLALIADADIAISGASNNVFTFNYPAAVTVDTKTKIWSLRDANNTSAVKLNGTLNVLRAAVNPS